MDYSSQLIVHLLCIAIMSIEKSEEFNVERNDRDIWWKATTNRLIEYEYYHKTTN